MNKKTLGLIGIVIVIIGVILLLSAIIYSSHRSPQNDNQNATSTDNTVGWLTYKDSEGRYEFKYPATFGANVWHADKWPPKVSILTSTQNPEWDICSHTNDAQEKQVEIGGYSFKFIKENDIGAGSLYSTYCYTTQVEKAYYVVSFQIWSAAGCGQGNCGPYCETPSEAECVALDRAKAIDEPIQQIMSTFKIIKTDPFASVSTSDWKKYDGTDISFNYPSDISLKTNSKTKEIILSHSVPYVHEEVCNMNNPGTIDKIDDFDVSISVVNKNLQDTASLDNLEIKYTADVSIDLKDKGKINGYRFESQVEACGEWLYYFPLSDNKTLRVTRSLVSEFRSFICGNNCDQLIKSLPNAISPDKEEIIFNKILSSLTF